MSSPRMRWLLILPVLLATSGCNLLYRMDIQQGNVITQEMVSKLKPDMTRSQVRFVLGTALIEDPFRPNRWDYYYSMRHGVTGAVQQRRLTVYFDGDRLTRVEGDVVPPEMKAEGEIMKLTPTELIPTPFNTEPSDKPAPSAPTDASLPGTQTEPAQPTPARPTP